MTSVSTRAALVFSPTLGLTEDIILNNSAVRLILGRGRVVIVSANPTAAGDVNAAAGGSGAPAEKTATEKRPDRLPLLPGVLLNVDSSTSPPSLVVLVECPAGFQLPASAIPKPEVEAVKGLKVLKKKGDDSDDDDMFGGGGGKKKGGKGSKASAPASSGPSAACVTTGWFGAVGASVYTIMSVPLQCLTRVSSLLCKAATFEAPKGIPLTAAREVAAFIDVGSRFLLCPRYLKHNCGLLLLFCVGFCAKVLVSAAAPLRGHG